MTDSSTPPPVTSGVVAKMMQSFFPPILMLIAIIAGAAALWLTPREEDPQIVVPMADVLVNAPGLSARQVERQVTEPLERLLKQIDGVEYVYSTSMTGQAMVIVRFEVGEERENSLVKLYNKLYSHQDLIPPSVSNWIIKPVEIDDVPILVTALYSSDSQRVDRYQLRRIAEQASHRLQALDNTNKVSVVGGMPRQFQVTLDTAALASRMTTVEDIKFALGVSNHRRQAGSLNHEQRSFKLETGQFYRDSNELRQVVINVIDGLPVYLQDVATITDGADEPTNYTWFSHGPAFDHGETPAEGDRIGDAHPAVFIAVAKQKGSNAVWVADDLLAELERIGQELPGSVHQAVIRNYGQTANEKVGNLVSSLGISILTVVIFVGFFLNWRAAVVVGLAIPISYGAALAMDLAFGYSINRVTLFALILALGLIVDDPIASIDNIERYLRQSALGRSSAIITAMAEIRSALLMSTVAIVIVFTPMFFITGMMGPYMAPLAFNVPVSVVFSTVVAFLITPWLAKQILTAAQRSGAYQLESSLLYRIYSRALTPLLASRKRSWGFLAVIGLLFAAAAILPALRIVPLKLLPYDNKNEFQLVLNLPEARPLEATAKALADFNQYLVRVPEVASISAFAGVASPMDFNGMVRHYFLRNAGHEGELRIVLAQKDRRRHQSHELVTRLRDDLQQIADRHQADIQLVETPPGPPVIATVVAEVYGQSKSAYHELNRAAEVVADRLKREPMVREVDTTVIGAQQTWQFVIDKEKAALSGISTEDINNVIAAANAGETLSYLQDSHEINPTPIRLRLPPPERDNLTALESLYLRGRAGVAKEVVNGALQDAPQPLVQLAELGRFQQVPSEQPIYHKNLKPVAYVYAEAAGRVPAEVVVDVMADLNGDGPARPLSQRSYLHGGGGDPWQLDDQFKVVWNGEGEWKITLDVFRDLGIAYGAALLGVFVVMVIQTGLPAVSGIIMLAIPLTVIGIMPGFSLLNLLGETRIGAYPNPALFTATAMIGMIALAGIVVRNSLVLIEFVHQALAKGKPLQTALLEAGAVRMRPILLTAGTTMLGNIVITLDPIFNGLAWAIIFGISASTLFTLLVIPVVYHLAYANKPGHGLPVTKETT